MSDAVWITLFIILPVVAVLTALVIFLDDITGKVGEQATKAEKEKQNEQ